MTCQEKILSNDYIDIISDFPISFQGITEETADSCSFNLETDLSMAYINKNDIAGINLMMARYQYVPKCYGLMESQTNLVSDVFNPKPLIDSGIIEVNSPPLNLTGKGVIIGFIDTGIRYDMDVFKNSDGTSRILAIWDQTIQTGTHPETIPYGSEYTNEMINNALASENPLELVPSIDTVGHGTKIASVAAGSILQEGSRFRGAAPDAQIIMVKLKQAKAYLKDFYRIPQEVRCYQENDILCGLYYLQTFARMFERPLIICIGVGTNLGDHMGVSFMSAYIEQLSLRRSYGTVICAGNEGASATHYEGKIDVENGQIYSDVEVRVGENEEGFIIELWTDTPNLLSVAIKTPVGELTPEISFRSPQPAEFDFVYNNSSIRVEYILIEQSSGDEVIRMRFTRPQSGIWTIRVFSRGPYGDNIFHMWLPIRQFLRSDTAFLQPSPYTTITAPGYTEAAMTISSYNNNNNSFSYTSGRGFGRQGQLKPDIAAPGTDISTVLGRDSGTSMAAAIAAGAMANFYQWAVVERNDIIINGVSARNYFIRGAQRDSNLAYPNREWGYGRLNLAGIFDVLAGQGSDIF